MPPHAKQYPLLCGAVVDACPAAGFSTAALVEGASAGQTSAAGGYQCMPPRRQGSGGFALPCCSKVNRTTVVAASAPQEEGRVALGVTPQGKGMVVEQRKKRQISCRLRIEQRMVDPITNESYFDILTKIASFLNCNLLLRKQVATGNVYYTLTASSSKSLQIIIDYFECYPLYSSKYLDYKD